MPSLNALERWLGLTWNRPERSYNPDLQAFIADLLGYPREKVVTEDRGAIGYPDLKLLTLENQAWIVGDLKPDDKQLTLKTGRDALWKDKKKYVDGLVRYALFVTPHFLWVLRADGKEIIGLETPLDLRETSLSDLQTRLEFLSYGAASHDLLWQQFVSGEYPYSYLILEDDTVLRRLRTDLLAGFRELSRAAESALALLRGRYQDYGHRVRELERNALTSEGKRRVRIKLEREYRFERHLFDESFSQFQEQYGRDIDKDLEKRTLEAFATDSVAALIARVLFLRLLEDLNLTTKRRLTDGGPKRWADFVEFLTGSANALVRVASEDLSKLYREPFEESVFDWIGHTSGELDTALQRLILRLNAYDFAGLSEEILGDIYQQFLPIQKRKQLGEFYTPPSIVDWLLEQTVLKSEKGRVLDPSSGSGSFLVRLLHHLLEDASKRGLDKFETRTELQARLWGFDLNPFASFISHFQLMWGLLRYQPSGEPPTIHVYNLNSLLRDTDIAPFLGADHLAPGTQARDEGKWRFVVGNPPYIRAERVKYDAEMKAQYAGVWDQNSDTGLLFLYRALTEWLEPGGSLAMVVSGGYASSGAAAKVWKLLHPSGNYTLRKLVWLEFVGRLWDAAVIPMLLVIENRPPEEDDEIEILTPRAWPTPEEAVKVRYADFWDVKVNPKVSSDSSHFRGEYLLPMLKPEDVTLLRRLAPNGNGSGFMELKNVMQARGNQDNAFTYGIQRGGVEVTTTANEPRSVQVFGGANIAVAWAGEPRGWVNLDAVEMRPYGKLSLWRGDAPESFIVSSELALAPFAAVVKKGVGVEQAALNSVVVGVPQDGISSEVIAAYINSKLVRFYWAVKLRSGVLEGSSRAHIYPRTLDALPWPRHPDPTQLNALEQSYAQLSELAALAKNSPQAWLAQALEQHLAAGALALKSRTLGLVFGEWQTDPTVADLQLEGNTIVAGLLARFELLDADLAELVYHLLQLQDDDVTVTKALIGKLVVPQNYPELMQGYRQHAQEFAGVERDFHAALETLDQTVYALFGLSEEEKTHIEMRLSSFPLDRFKPRYPWQAVKVKSTRAYTTDRFS